MRLFKKFLSTTLAAAMVAATLTAAPAMKSQNVSAASNFDYGEALTKSLLFYELQESGKLQDGIRTNWRGDAMLDAGADNGVDLTGGWNDAGDNLKLNLPGTYTSTMLAWSYLEDKDVYKTTGQDKYILEQIKWECDYLLKCHTSENELYFQVGADNDHAFWGAAEIVPLASSSYKCTVSQPGSCVTASTAASLATAYLCFKDSDPAYAQKCLTSAKQLLNLAIKMNSDSYYNSVAGAYYNSWGGFADDISFASCWLYKATKDASYLDTAVDYSNDWEVIQGTDEWAFKWTQCWDNNTYGARILLSELTGDKKYIESTEKYLDYWTTGTADGERIPYSPKGEAVLDQWGSLRYATTTGFMAEIWADSGLCTESKVDTYKDFAKQQADYALGSSGQCFVCGYDDPTAPVSPHHRTASGVWTNNLNAEPKVNRHVLTGALVGGPTSANDKYTDTRTDYTMNEVAVDYNAGYTGLMAKLYKEYGGTIDSDLSAVEEVGDEFQVTAGINAQDNTNATSFVEMKATVYNKTAWPARKTDNLSYKYFVDISDVLAKGYKASDFTVKTNYNQTGSKVSGLQPWDEDNGIYYVNVDMSGAGLYPGGQSECRSELQFRISAPCKWDYSKNPSLQGITGSTAVDAKYIALYEGDKLVWGQTPDGGSTAVKYAPTVSIVSPEDGAVFTDITKENPVTLTADAAVQDSTISKVEFYNGTVKIGTAESAPYSVSFVPANDGSGIAKDYTITAKAYAKNGETTTSDAVKINITQPKLEAPAVAVTSPESGTVYTTDNGKADIAITADASVKDSTISKVEVYVEGSKAGTAVKNEDGSYGFTYTYTNNKVYSEDNTETLSIYTIAYAENGTSTKSDVVTVDVTVPATIIPSVAITSPADKTVFEIGTETIDVSALAAVTKGSVKAVKFYANGTLFATVTDAKEGVYTATYTVNTAAKEKSIKFTAVAVSDKDVEATSDVVTSTVKYEGGEAPEGFAITVGNQTQTADSTNTISNNFNIVNTGSYDIDLSKLEIRYFFTADGNASQVSYIDHSAAQMNVAPYYATLTSSIKASIVKMDTAVENADTYVSYTFDNTTILPNGGNLILSSRIANSDWSNFNQTNDFSYGDAANVAVYYDGVLVAGMEP